MLQPCVCAASYLRLGLSINLRKRLRQACCERRTHSSGTAPTTFQPMSASGCDVTSSAAPASVAYSAAVTWLDSTGSENIG